MTLPKNSNPAAQAAFEAAVKAQCAHFTNSFDAGDTDGLVDGYYTDTPVMIGPDMPVVIGRPAIKDVFKGMRGSGIVKLKIEPVHCTVDADLGYEIGRATLTIKQGDSNVVQPARYIITWRNTSDGWRAETDFFAMGEI